MALPRALRWIPLFAALPLTAQAPRPAAEYLGLMNLRFYEASARFMLDGEQLLFPPGGNAGLALVVRQAGGAEVARLAVRLQPMGNFTTFARMLPAGGPGFLDVGKAGDYVLALQLGHESLTELPFTLTEAAGSDPYNPTRRYVREGPWSRLAVVTWPLDQPEGQVKAGWWMSTRELPAGGGRALATVHLLRNGAEVAASPSPVVPSQDDWQFLQSDLVSGGRPLTRGRLLAQPGEYRLEVRVGGAVVKAFPLRVQAGAAVAHPRSALDYQPHAGFLAARYVDVSRGSSSSWAQREVLWLERAGR